MKQMLISLLKALGLYKLYVTPARISANFKKIDTASTQKLLAYIKQEMFTGKNINDPVIKEDIEDHISNRLEKFRHRHIPFLDHTFSLANKTVLEIGCGTGSSSIALAEQGARVVGLDVDEPSLKIAGERANVYKLNDKISLTLGNATELDKLFKEGQFDIVIFFASIEHMTHHERIAALKGAWHVLKKGGGLCILGTPNRLWYLDVHTSYLPFYMWLPDDLALEYSAFSPRDGFNQLYKHDYKQIELEFLRWGRGVSYHELEVAIKPVAQLQVLGDLHSFQRPKTFLQKLMYRQSDEYRFKQLLTKAGPANLPQAFYEYYLDFAIKKD